ncbi:TerB family tellurite resistance protein [Paraliomyxa miuraensis]|uniref:TerB family tellurite resistance protein n=1 Tax=Paraliomyxa miuraensis TaxID=376150 RepID=UPI0022538CD5|nr:TerB family tellurite resistance protein [Paraliomyxa miuraensis]MCX4241480.1 TerB family tellurite resistance protein [Paraliomyxa miuraensis]
MVDAALDSLVRRVMVRVAMIDGTLHEDEVARLRWTVGRLTGSTPDEQQVRDDVAEVLANARPLPELIEQARRELDVEGRRTVVRAACAIATADGVVPAAEEALLLEIARGLDISPAELRALASPLALARALAEP